MAFLVKIGFIVAFSLPHLQRIDPEKTIDVLYLSQDLIPSPR